MPYRLVPCDSSGVPRVGVPDEYVIFDVCGLCGVPVLRSFGDAHSLSVHGTTMQPTGYSIDAEDAPGGVVANPNIPDPTPPTPLPPTPDPVDPGDGNAQT